MKVRSKKTVFFIVLATLGTTVFSPALIAEQNLEHTPVIWPEQEEIEAVAFFTTTTRSIFELTEKLTQECENILIKDDAWSQGSREKLANLKGLNNTAQKSFDEFITYISRPADEMMDSEARQLFNNFQDAFKDFLSEVRYVFDDSFARLASESLEALKGQWPLPEKPGAYADKQAADPRFNINKAIHEIGTNYLSQFDKKDLAKYNQALIKYNDVLMAVNNLRDEIKK